jgi:hypothetical protein
MPAPCRGELRAKSLPENFGGLRFGSAGGLGFAGQTPGHDDDHGPVDVGLVAGGQVLVVADGPPVAGDSRQGALDDPAAGQDLERVQVIGPLTSRG